MKKKLNMFSDYLSEKSADQITRSDVESLVELLKELDDIFIGDNFCSSGLSCYHRDSLARGIIKAAYNKVITREEMALANSILTGSLKRHVANLDALEKIEFVKESEFIPPPGPCPGIWE